MKNNKLMETINLFNDSKEERNGSTLYRGSILKVNIYGDESIYYNQIQEIGGFKNIEGGNGYSYAIKNDELLTLSTWCEGDIDFEVCSDLETYANKVAQYTEFYTENF